MQKYSEALAKIFPERVNRFSDRDLSRFWRESNFRYIARVRNKIVNLNNPDYNPDFRFSDSLTSLKLLEDKIKECLGAKGIGCLRIIELYRNNNITTTQFIDIIEIELGRVSGIIEVTDIEMSSFLGGYKEFIRNIKDTLTNFESKRNFNPNYKFSKQQISRFRESYIELMFYQAEKCLECIEIYSKLNDLPSRPEYDDLLDERYFSLLDSIEKAYWYGFLCADGYIASKRSRISFELAAHDKERIRAFANLLGLDHRRIKTRDRLFYYKGELKSLKSCRIRFSSKLMKDDLFNNGIFSLKSGEEGIPNSIKKNIQKANMESKVNNKPWFETHSGKIALAWLLGFFDGDGTYMGKYKGGQSGKIYSSNRLVLDDIKKYFEIENNVNPIKLFSEDVLLTAYHSSKEGFYVSKKPIYYLTLGPDIYSAMIDSYRYSMKRKRSYEYSQTH